MSDRVYRPSRPFRGETLPLAEVFALTLAVIASFPIRSLGFVPAAEPPRRARPVFAYVELPAGVEARILASARAAWQVDSVGVKQLRAELICPVLPSDDGRQVLGWDDRDDRFGRVCVPYAPSLLPRGGAAEPPAAIPAAPETPPAEFFPRKELLDIDFMKKGTVR